MPNYLELVPLLTRIKNRIPEGLKNHLRYPVNWKMLLTNILMSLVVLGKFLLMSSNYMNLQRIWCLLKSFWVKEYIYLFSWNKNQCDNRLQRVVHSASKPTEQIRNNYVVYGFEYFFKFDQKKIKKCEV